jgi:16S rRNA (guanine527-N7)-methyltransferase
MEQLAQQAHDLLGVRLSRRQIKAFEIYERELLAWNARTNLTAIRDPREIRNKHFLDSLSCLLVLREGSTERVIDVGTGAGFPGLVIKIALPGVQLTLVDSVGKKVDFCQHLVSVLALDGVEVIQERAEAIGQDPRHRQCYDWALARAVANLSVLAEYLLPLVRVGGGMLAMKGESGPAEAHTADHAIHLLGGHLRQLVPVMLPGVADKRYLVVADKVAATPDGYPRRTGIPIKRPL